MRLMRLASVIVAVLVLGLAAPARAQVLVGSCVLTSGSGSPESSATGNVCDTYLRTDTGDLYQKTTGTGNTGWSLLPRVDAANVYTSGQQELTATFPRWIFTDSDQAADTQKWRVGSQSGQFFIQAVNDALSVTQSTVFTALRNGDVTFPTSVTAASLAATTGSLTSTLHVGGNFDVGTTKFTVAASTGVTTINNNTASLPTPATGTLLQLGNANATQTIIQLDAFAQANQVMLRRANTTAASPSALAAGDIMGRVGGAGYGTAYVGNKSAIDFVAAETWTGSAQGAYLSFLTTASGGTSLAEKVRIHGSGGVSIGTVSTDPGTSSIGITGDIKPFTNYTSSIGDLDQRMLAIWGAELWIETLVAQNTTATIGGRIVVAPTTFLTADLAPAGTLITVKHNNLVNGDRVFLQTNNSLEWMAIASSAGGSAGAYTYTVTRNLDGSGADQWYAGDAIVDTGTTGNGFIDLYSVSGISAGTTGPTIVFNVRTGTTYTNVAPRGAIGNLDGLFNYSGTTYGAAFGDASATNVTIDATNGLRIRSGTTNKLTADTSGNLNLVGDLVMGTAGVFRMAATAFGTGTGGWMDYNSGTPRFRFGNPSGNRVSWDGTDIVVVSANLTINGSGMTIGGSSAFSAARAYNFTRPAGLNFGQSGDVLAMWFMGSAGLEDLYLQNKIVGDGTSDGTARVILKAQGWENAAGGSSTTEASITLTSSNANQQVDLTAPVIQFSGSTSVSVLTASFKVNNAAANLEVTNGTTTMSTQPGFFGTTSNHAWIVLTNNGTNSTYCAAGGFTVGAPTGGCKGAGTANFAADIYKNNSAYGNPDFVFEHWATGKIEKFAQNDGASTYRGLMPLDDLQRYVRRHYRYPLIPDGPVGMFGRADIVLALTEQNTLYLFQLADRLAALEFEVARLKGGR